MKQTLLLGALAVMLVLVFVSVVPASAQTNPSFKAWLADMDGSKWVRTISGGKWWWELHGDIITKYGSRNDNYGSYKAGVPYKTGTATLRGRRFTFAIPGGNTYLCEISEDGLVLTEEITSSGNPDWVGEKTTYVKEN
jgi:hypothetical protein